MSDDIVLRVSNLGKCFKIYANPWHRAREWVSLRKRNYHETFWSLRNISFEVRRGEFIGIIGQNGAGKSTLLKIITGVLQPTEGRCELKGKILSLLELGNDFNPYLSGRENAIRCAELLGFPDGYIQERLEEIAEFSELGEFFDRPIRLYSSGMRSRLAFSLYSFLECDILILDEVLATGDIFFQQKCFERLEKLIAKETTIIFVSHAMEVVKQYCDRVILIERGQAIYQGETKEGIRIYHQRKRGLTVKSRLAGIEEDSLETAPPTEQLSFWPSDEVFTSVCLGNNDAQLTRFAVCDAMGEPCNIFKQGEAIYFYAEFKINRDIEVPIAGVFLTNKFNVLVHGKASLHYQINVPQRVNQNDRIRLCQSITLNLQPNEYVFDLALATMPQKDYACLKELTVEEPTKNLDFFYISEKVGAFWIVPSGEKRHMGICDLPGFCQIQVIASEKLKPRHQEGKNGFLID